MPSLFSAGCSGTSTRRLPNVTMPSSSNPGSVGIFWLQLYFSGNGGPRQGAGGLNRAREIKPELVYPAELIDESQTESYPLPDLRVSSVSERENLLGGPGTSDEGTGGPAAGNDG